uniref:Uncharacterized protein n=1 Tax=uncultured prokaryote TaxID=198431 RepID=A0A0H5Q3S8_9ZZZZ|nr:hypothetical protein [uncultured prokaryote]
MAYLPHTLVTFGGVTNAKAAGDEIWQCGIRGFQTGGGPVGAGDLDDLALLILRGPTGDGGGLQNLFADARAHMGGTSYLSWCKAANIGADGKYSAEPGYAQMTPVAGGSAAQAPSFCSVAVSFGTGKTLGRGIRGRIYLPNYGAVRSNGVTIDSTSQTNILEWSVDMLRAVDTTNEDIEFHPWIVSQSGAANLITEIRVGDVWDTQRRRKDAISESYSGSSFAP